MTQSDLNLQEIIQEVLSQQMNLTADSINVEVARGRVILTGIVDVLSEKSFAAEVVKGIPGVRSVDNSITIAMERGMGDKEVTEVVADRLDRDGFDLKHISVETIDGVVFLRGQIESVGESMLAIKTAQKVRAVKEVISELGLLPAASNDDATITNAVELALSRSDKVDVRDVVTSTKHGEVNLEGWVDTKEEISAAVALASTVTGVKKVHNHLVSSQDATQGDVKLTRDVRRLLAEHNLNSIKVWVVGGSLFMGGEVSSIDQKKQAQELVRKVKGLVGISNSIAVTIH